MFESLLGVAQPVVIHSTGGGSKTFSRLRRSPFDLRGEDLHPPLCLDQRLPERLAAAAFAEAPCAGAR